MVIHQGSRVYIRSEQGDQTMKIPSLPIQEKDMTWLCRVKSVECFGRQLDP